MMSILMSGQTATAEVWDRWIGQSVNGKFPLRQRLGGSDHSAAFATVRDGQKATIKLVPADLANVDRHLARWHLGAQLSHPHLIRLFEVGRCRLGNNEFIFAVMEYAEENLAQILPNRALTAAETRDILEPTLEALAYLHGHGLVHGHIKPPNILAVKEQLKLSRDELLRPGEPNQAAGKTGAYDPPERATGTVSPAGDLWSLGITLVEALTQRRPPFNAKGDPMVPQSLPEPFREIVNECLRRDPQQRATVAAIRAKLKQISPGRTETNSKSREARPKHRLILPIVAAFVIIAVLVARPRFSHRTPEPAKTAPTATSQPKAQPKAEPSLTPNSAGQFAGTAPPAKPSPARPQTGGAKVAETVNTPPSSGIIERVLPRVPESARHTIEGTVRVGVRVHVNPSGNVGGAEFDSPGPSRYFAHLAMQAAQKWKFAPAPEPRDWVLRFSFQRTGTNVSPVQVGR